MSPLRICLDARLVSGRGGGVEQVVIGLASGLSGLPPGGEEFLFLTYRDADDWLRPYLRGACHILPGPRAPYARTRAWLSRRAPFLQNLYLRLKSLRGPEAIPIEESDGTIEQAHVDVMHFTYQRAFLTRVPSLYEPYDLQHLHLPQFFSSWQRMDREVRYRAFCRQAKLVVATSSWVRGDLIRQYNLPPGKVIVVPLASVLAAYPAPTSAQLSAVVRKFNLPVKFIYYPVATWPHKNHLALLDSLHRLRRTAGLEIPLVCSGLLTAHFSRIRKHLRKLKLGTQVRFLGFLSPLELQCLYQLCWGVVFPTLFEGWGMPLSEAFHCGRPIACSNIPVLAEQANDAALLFDPRSVDEIAKAVQRLWTDGSLCRELVERGHKNAARLSWLNTAKSFRAQYRLLAGRPLTEEDRALIEASQPRVMTS